MKKKLFSTLVLAVAFASVAFSQIEVKVNPVGLLWGGVSASGEYILSDNMGVEVSARLASRNLAFTSEDVRATGFGAGAQFKYYFSPNQGGDGFYASAYLRYAGLSGKYTGELSGTEETVNWNKTAVGLGLGYKWVADSGLLFEIGGGVGRNLSSKWTYSDDSTIDFSFPFDATFRLSVGYRF